MINESRIAAQSRMQYITIRMIEAAYLEATERYAKASMAVIKNSNDRTIKEFKEAETEFMRIAERYYDTHPTQRKMELNQVKEDKQYARQ